MMICSKCGKDNPEDNWACGGCGEPVLGANPTMGGVSPYSEQQGPAYPGQPAADYTQTPSQPRPPSSGRARKGSRGSGLTLILIAVMVAAIAGVPAWHFLKHSPNKMTPTGTMEAYLDAINDNDCRTLYKLTPNDMKTDASDEDLDTCSDFMDLVDLNISDLDVLGETIDGDTATVDFKANVEFGNQSIPQRTTAALIKEDGIWKVDSSLS